MSPPEYCGVGVHPKQPFTQVDKWASQQPIDAWHRVDVRAGEKSPLFVEALMRRVQTGRGKNTAEETLVIIRYCDRESVIVKVDYYLGYAFETQSLAEFCRVARAAHRIEECIQRAKGEFGMAEFEVRNWVG